MSERQPKRILKKIIWAADAFTDNPRLQTTAGEAIASVTVDTGLAEIEPVFILRPDQIHFPEKPEPNEMRQVSITAENKMDAIAKNARIAGVANPSVILQDGRSLRQAVKALVRYTEEQDADLVAVSTRGRRGVRRLFLGSFTEELLVRSHVPVLVVSPAAETSRKWRRVLFPTDFSENSRAAFERYVAVAKSQNATIFLFHKLQYMRPRIGYPFVPPTASRSSVRAYRAEKKRLAEDWVAWAKEQGVKVRPHVAVFGDSAPGAVLRASKRLKTDAIVMAGNSGPVTVAVLGSLSREIVRCASVPVLVFPSGAVREKARSRNDRKASRLEPWLRPAPVLR